MRHIFLLALFISVPLAAEEPPPLAIVQGVLQLTPDQITALERLVETRRATVEPLAREAMQLQQSLAEALQSESPDPVAVGTAVLAIRGTERQIEAHRSQFVQNFQTLLNAEQKSRLEHIRGIAGALRAASALQALGL